MQIHMFVGMLTAIGAVIGIGVFLFFVASWCYLRQDGQPAWKGLIPIYNYYQMCCLGNCPGIFPLMLSCTFLTLAFFWSARPDQIEYAWYPLAAMLVLHVMHCVMFARSYGRGIIFTLLLILFYPYVLAITGFTELLHVEPWMVTRPFSLCLPELPTREELIALVMGKPMETKFSNRPLRKVVSDQVIYLPYEDDDVLDETGDEQVADELDEDAVAQSDEQLDPRDEMDESEWPEDDESADDEYDDEALEDDESEDDDAEDEDDDSESVDDEPADDEDDEPVDEEPESGDEELADDESEVADEPEVVDEPSEDPDDAALDDMDSTATIPVLDPAASYFAAGDVDYDDDEPTGELPVIGKHARRS